MGSILIPKECEWEFINDTSCPAVPEEEQLDWECHHKTSNCEHNKYLDPKSEHHQETKATDDSDDTENSDDTEDDTKTTRDKRMSEILAILRSININDPTETILVPLIFNLLEPKSAPVITFSPNIEIKMPDNVSRVASIREQPRLVFEMDKLPNLEHTVTFNLSDSDTGSFNVSDNSNGSSSSNLTTELFETTQMDAVQRRLSITEARVIFLLLLSLLLPKWNHVIL